MKKLVCTIVNILLLVLAISSCKYTSENFKTDNSYFKEKNSYLNLSPSELYIDSKNVSFAKLFPADIGTHDIGVFRTDSGLYYTRYVQTTRLKNSTTYPVLISDLYSMMFKGLGIAERFEYNDRGLETMNGVRIYPAITKNTSKDSILYLVLMGEESYFDPAEALVSKTMLDSNYYQIREGKFSKIDPADTVKVKDDIKSFQRFWKSEAGGIVLSSYSFSINKYYAMLNVQNLDIYPGLTDAAEKYGIAFYPCVKDDTLKFVIKGFKDISPTNRFILNHKPVYNNMDICPKLCPKKEITTP